MNATSICPDADQLHLFAAGSLSATDHDQLQEHLSQCDQCKLRVTAAPDSVGLSPRPLSTRSPRRGCVFNRWLGNALLAGAIGSAEYSNEAVPWRRTSLSSLRQEISWIST